MYCAGGVAEGGHTDNTDNTRSRDHQEPPHRRHAQRAQDVVPAHTRSETDGPRLVHVPDQYGPHEEPSRIPRRCR